jgi:hypothetical protein
MAVRLGLLCALAAVVFATVAVVDHRHKAGRLAEARRAEWFCRHRQVLCGETPALTVERAWNRRERIYVAGMALGGLGFVAGVAAAGRGRLRQRLS